MDKKDKYEEIQSRREFFKNAAKSALPIFAAILAANPIVGKAAEVSTNGCGMSCKFSCVGNCRGGCRTSCQGTCDTTCRGGCKNYACKGVAKN